MLVKIHDSYRNGVAICDENLIGKCFRQGRGKLDINDLYKGEKKNKEETIKIIEDMKKEDATFNIVGDESIKLALEIGLIDSEGIKKIDNVPYALVLL